MDRTEEDMRSVGFFGIFHQSFKTIFSRKQIFAQITLAFILPLAIVFSIHLEISHHFFRRIENTSLPYPTDDDKYSREPAAFRWFYYALFQIAYFIFLTVFSVLSTAAVVFTVASIYTGRDVDFRSIVKVIPKVWKRLLITFVCIYIAQFIYNVMINIVMVIFNVLLDASNLFVVLLIIVVVLYVLGFLYLSVVCQLASVVTVLENVNGFKAMKKGKQLANGKKKVGMGIAFVLYVILLGLIFVYFLFVEYGDEVFRWALIWRVLMGILCGILLLVLLLLFIVAQTVLYLVCKSYHREAIDKLSLSTFLGAYMAETVVYPRSGEIQLGSGQSPANQV